MNFDHVRDSNLDELFSSYRREITEYEEKRFDIQQKIKACFLDIYRLTDNFYAKKYAGEGLQLPFGDTLRAHKLKAIQILANTRDWNTSEGMALRKRLSGLIHCINLR